MGYVLKGSYSKSFKSGNKYFKKTNIGHTDRQTESYSFQVSPEGNI